MTLSEVSSALERALAKGSAKVLCSNNCLGRDVQWTTFVYNHEVRAIAMIYDKTTIFLVDTSRVEIPTAGIKAISYQKYMALDHVLIKTDDTELLFRC